MKSVSQNRLHATIAKTHLFDNTLEWASFGHVPWQDLARQLFHVQNVFARFVEIASRTIVGLNAQGIVFEDHRIRIE